jgi:hypothetical protein
MVEKGILSEAETKSLFDLDHISKSKYELINKKEPK